jgi:hypothetical protein
MPPSELLSPFHQFLAEVKGSLTFDNQQPIPISKLKLWVPNPTDDVTEAVQTYLRRRMIKHTVDFITFDPDPTKTPKAPWNDNWLVLGIPLERGSSTVKSIEDNILAHMPPNSILAVCGEEWDHNRCYFFPLERQDLTHQFNKRRGRHGDLLLFRDYSVWDESQFHGGFSGEDEIFADADPGKTPLLSSPFAPGPDHAPSSLERLLRMQKEAAAPVRRKRRWIETNVQHSTPPPLDPRLENWSSLKELKEIRRRRGRGRHSW